MDDEQVELVIIRVVALLLVIIIANEDLKNLLQVVCPVGDIGVMATVAETANRYIICT